MIAPTDAQWRTDEVVDLRAVDGGPDVAPGTPHPWPTPPVVTPDRSGLRRRRLIAVAVLLTLLGLVAADFVVGHVLHDQRQRHLAAAFRTPSPQPQPGDPVGILQVPSIGINQLVAEGADASELRGGPAVVPTGAPLGSRGTTVIVGHRYRYGGPFGALHRVKKGATAVVELPNTTIQTFRVVRVQHVARDDRRVFDPTKGQRVLLVTDDGGVFPDRLVVATLRPDQPSTVGRAPTQPVLLSGGPSPASFVLVAALVIAFVVSMAVAGAHLRRRYARGTVLTVLVPIAGLAIVVVVLSLDLAFSALA